MEIPEDIKQAALDMAESQVSVTDTELKSREALVEERSHEIATELTKQRQQFHHGYKVLMEGIREKEKAG